MAITQVLDDPNRQGLSNIDIAKICGCSEAMVRKYKKELLGIFQDDDSDDDNSIEINFKVKLPKRPKK